MFVSYLVRSQFVIPNRLLCGVPVGRQSVNSSEITCSLDIENDLVTFADLRPGLVAVCRPNILLCQNRPVAFDDGPNPVGGHMPRRGILLRRQKTLPFQHPASSERRSAPRSSGPTDVRVSVDLQLDRYLAAKYSSSSQVARVLTEAC